MPSQHPSTSNRVYTIQATQYSVAVMVYHCKSIVCLPLSHNFHGIPIVDRFSPSKHPTSQFQWVTAFRRETDDTIKTSKSQSIVCTSPAARPFLQHTASGSHQYTPLCATVTTRHCLEKIDSHHWSIRGQRLTQAIQASLVFLPQV